MTGKATPRAHVEERNGSLVLVDPDAVAVLQAVAKANCRMTLADQIERVRHFARRITELGKSPDEVVIVLANVDTEIGAAVADALMPNYDWEAIRQQGEIPYARGLAGRDGWTEVLGDLDHAAAEAFQKTAGRITCLVFDHDTIAVFTEEDWSHQSGESHAP